MKRLCTIKISGCEDCLHIVSKMPVKGDDGKYMIDKERKCGLTDRDVTEMWWNGSPSFDEKCPLVEAGDDD